MIVDRFGAMGTQVEAHGTDADALDEVQAWFATVEACCSRFLPDSDLSRVNAAAGRPVEPGPVLVEVLAAAAVIRDLTGGLVDPAVGRRVADWGYDRTFAEVGGLDQAPPPGEVGSWRFADGVLLAAPGTALDLGGIAKGWACDRAVEMGLASMVSAGGDLRSSDPGMVVDVKGTGGDVLAEVEVGEGAVATSTTRRRRWRVGGGEASHLIDPRTGDPVDSPVVGATVAAATALEAEAGAKSVLLLGAGGLAWAARQPWLRMALVEWHDGTAFATEVAA
ncbi:MAG: FAD:protein FMN transferase [Actinobacteria bacterium]|nr:FAD:protein FMN transferase [Actinomycetota bacterium]